MQARDLLAYAALFFCIFFFASNAIFGRLAQDVEPYTLAFLRWSITGAILLVVSLRHLRQMMKIWRENILLFVCMGWLGMWLAGGTVYNALQSTSATNGLLIYTLPPALVIVFEFFFRGRKSKIREWAGIALAFIGVLWIMAQGEWSRLTGLQFNPGDLMFLAAAIGWAIYTLCLRSKPLEPLGTFALLTLVALTGTAVLTPFMLLELFDPLASPFPTRGDQWLLIGGTVFSASLAAFGLYNFGVKVIGPSLASIFMYLLAPIGIFEAWLFLGEVMGLHHWIGAVLVLGGVVIATLPTQFLPGQRSN